MKINEIMYVTTLELEFSVNQVWRPCNILGTADNRTLGISISSIEVSYKENVL